MPSYQSLADHKNNPADYQRAKELRQTSPLAEQILWHKLRLASKTQSFRFRRQHPIQPYIVDFVCLKLRLVIEIDGASHDTRLDQDKKREDALKNLGYCVMRFTNNEVMTNCDGVVQTIFNRAHELAALTVAPLPQPLPQGEGSTTAHPSPSPHNIKS